MILKYKFTIQNLISNIRPTKILSKEINFNNIDISFVENYLKDKNVIFVLLTFFARKVSLLISIAWVLLRISKNSGTPGLRDFS